MRRWVRSAPPLIGNTTMIAEIVPSADQRGVSPHSPGDLSRFAFKSRSSSGRYLTHAPFRAHVGWSCRNKGIGSDVIVACWQAVGPKRDRKSVFMVVLVGSRWQPSRFLRCRCLCAGEARKVQAK